MSLSQTALESLTGALRDSKAEIVTPDKEQYGELIQRWSEAAVKHAGAVVLPLTAEDVAAIVNVARESKTPFTVAAGRHSTGGGSSVEEGIVIDLRRMNGVVVDPEKKTITVQGGAIWQEVDEAAGKYGLATPGGTVNHTGVGGLTLGGGYGWLSGKYGLTIDNLLSAQMVLADGSIVTTSDTENSDLFWAIRGCGSAFGVATEFTFQAYDQGPVWAGLLAFTPDKLAKVTEFSNKFHEVNDGNQAIFVGFSAPPPMNAPVIMAAVFYNGTAPEAEKFFGDLIALGPVMQHVGEMPYEKLNGALNGAAGPGGRKSNGGSAVKCPLDLAFMQSVYDDFTNFIQTHEGTGESLVLFELLPFKKIIQRPLESTACANRAEYYNVGTIWKWYNPELDNEVRAFARTLHKSIREGGGTLNSKGVGAYSNYIDYPSVPDKLFGTNTPRLLELKKKYDPQNLFFRWHNLLPEGPVV